MALNPTQLKLDMIDVFSPPQPSTVPIAAQAWADAVDDYVSAAFSNGTAIIIAPGSKATMKTALEAAFGGLAAAFAADGIRTGVFNYIDAASFTGGTTEDRNDPGGNTFKSSLQTEFLILSLNSTAKGNAIGQIIIDFVASWKGNFPPPDPNDFPLV